MLIAISGVAILLAVVLYLLFGRAPAPPVDQAAQQKAMGEFIGAEVARQLAEKEKQLRAELEQERTQIEEQKRDLQQKQAAASASGQKVSAEDQRKIKAAQDDLAAREAEQKRKEDELAKIRAQREQAAAVPVQVPTVPPSPVPTEVPPTQPPAKEVVAAAPEREQAAAAAAVAIPAAAAPQTEPVAPPAATGEVREGDYLDFAQVEVPPQELTKVQPVLPRSAVLARPGKGIVILSALINEKGAVEKVDVLRGFPVPRYGIDEACVDAVKQYRYRPATKGGVKVKTRVTVTMQVDLSRTNR
jgi:TonB family protein